MHFLFSAPLSLHLSLSTQPDAARPRPHRSPILAFTVLNALTGAAAALPAELPAGGAGGRRETPAEFKARVLAARRGQ